MNHSIKGVVLDRTSFDAGDLDLSPFRNLLEHWTLYDSTNEGETAKRIGDATVIVVNKVAINENVLEQCPQLKLILLSATGSNNIDLDACRQHDISVCNARDYATPAVIQHTMAMILALTTRLIDYDKDVKLGKWKQSPVFCLLDHPISELKGKKLGIIGYGNLGRGVSRVAECFGMQVLIAQRPNSGDSSPRGRIPLPDLLPMIDALSIHCPLTSDTHRLIDHDALTSMKQSAILINTARGPIVDQQALAAALIAGKLAGAGIDVLDEEPPVGGNPLLEADIPNLIITPHTAWASIETRRRLIDELAANLAAWLNGARRNEL